MTEFLDMNMFSDYLVLGCAGFVGGVLIPVGFRLVGYVIDSVRIVLRGA